MIAESLLNRAAIIRKDYIKIMKDIQSYENISRDLISSLELRKNQFESLLEKVEGKKVTDAKTAAEELQKVLIDLELDLNRVDSSVKALTSDIDRLKEDEVKLHQEIKHSYPNLNDEEIKSEVRTFLKKLNLI